MQQLLIFIGKFQNRFLLEIQDLGCVIVLLFVIAATNLRRKKAAK